MAAVAKALGDPVRMQLVDVLRKHAGKVCVCELVPLFDLSQPTVSHHLKKLRDAGIVGSERQGLWAYYYVEPRCTGGAQRMAELGPTSRDRRRSSEAVRERYAAAADGAAGGSATAPAGRPGRDQRRAGAEVFGAGLYSGGDRDDAARGGAARIARLRQPDRGRRPARGRDRPRPRLRRRHRRAAVGSPRRADGQGLRPGHDRRDARARPREPARGGRRERRVPARARSRRSRCPTTRSTWSSPTA